MSASKGTITFVNASVFGASVYVLDENGNEKLVVDLSPNQSSKQDTVDGQAWMVKDKDTGRQVATATGMAHARSPFVVSTRGFVYHDTLVRT